MASHPSGKVALGDSNPLSKEFLIDADITDALIYKLRLKFLGAKDAKELSELTVHASW
jgi:hypothetical protein